MSSYITPAIGESGLVLPTYAEIRDSLIQTFLSIYGQQIYVQPDSADYQWISAVALKIADTLGASQLAYNARSPVTSVGSDLDGIVKLNGLVRKGATFSTCTVTITGTPFTVINNGVIQDTNGFLWNLPSTYTIPSGGSGNVSVTCQSPGNINAIAGALNIINTPTAGWVSVTNASAASPGVPIEADSQLRARQAISVALPSSTLLAGTAAEVAAVPGVTRSLILENATGSVDSYGNPAHSITIVVEGGDNTAIAQAIYDNKGIGPTVNGTNPGSGVISVVITDPNNGNFSQTINFFRPTYVPIYVSVTINPLVGYSSAITDAIQQNITNYLNDLEIGEAVTYSGVYWAALEALDNPLIPSYSITSLTTAITPTPTGTVDISLLFYQVSKGVLANVIITT